MREPPTSDDSAPHLIQLNRLKQRTKITLAKAFIPFALNDLEENRPDDVLRKYLQQHALVLLRITVNQNAAPLQLLQLLAMALARGR